MIFGTSQRLSQVNKSLGVHVAETHVQFADDVKLLGVTLDSTLFYVVDVTRSCHHHIRTLRHIRSPLTLDESKAMTASIAGSRLHYCNGILYGMSQANTDRLQRGQSVLPQVEAPWTISSTNSSRFTLVAMPVNHGIITDSASSFGKHLIPPNLPTCLN